MVKAERAPPSADKKTPRLTDAQRSFLKKLYRNGGHDRLYNASFRTAGILHDKGMVVVSIHDTHNGHVEITDAGRKVVEAIFALLESKNGRIDMDAFLSGRITPLT